MYDAARHVADVLALEAARLLAVAAMVRGSSPERAGLPELDRAMDHALATLDQLGVAYPGHVVAHRYGLDGPAYLTLNVALLPHHAPDDLDTLVHLLGCEGDELPTARHAVALQGPPESWPALYDELLASRLYAQRLVDLCGEGLDATLIVHPAVLELYGLASAA